MTPDEVRAGHLRWWLRELNRERQQRYRERKRKRAEERRAARAALVAFASGAYRDAVEYYSRLVYRGNSPVIPLE